MSLPVVPQGLHYALEHFLESLRKEVNRLGSADTEQVTQTKAGITDEVSGGLTSIPLQLVINTGTISADVTWTAIDVSSYVPSDATIVCLKCQIILNDGEECLVDVRSATGDTARPLHSLSNFEANSGDASSHGFGTVALDGLAFEYQITRQGSVEVNVWIEAYGAGGTVSALTAGGAHVLLDGSTITDSVAAGVAKGSLVVGNATPKWDDLIVGTDTFILTADSAETLGVKWAAPVGDGVNIISAGTQIAATTGTVIFSNSNGISFGMSNSSVITAAHNGLTTARASNDAIGLATAQTNVTWTVNSAGLSLNAGGYAGTGTSATNASVTLNSNGLAISVGAGGAGDGWNRISAGTQIADSTGTVVFSNSNGISFGMSNSSVVTASHNGLTSQSNQAVSFTSGSVAFQTLSFTNSNGISFNSGTQGIFASHNGLTTARASNDGIGLATAQTNVTWTVNSAGLSFNAGGYAGTGTSATNASITMNSNGLAISVAAPGAGGGATVSQFYNPPPYIMTTIGAPINASASFVHFIAPTYVTGTRVDVLASVNVATAANTSSGAILYTLSAVIYTKNGNTLNSVSSGTGASTVIWQSNSTGSVTGGKFISAPVNINMSPGVYFIGLQLSTRATGHAGANTTSLGNTLTVWGIGTAQFGAITAAEFNSSTNSSNGYFSVGMYSGTTNISAVSLSAISKVGTQANRAAVGVRILA